MKLAVTLLWITCVAFVGFGLAFTIAPVEVAELVTGTAPSEPSGVIDMRATYGGVAFGAGLFIGLCARRKEWVRPGLLVSLLVIASIGAARLIGVVVDGSPNGFMITFLVLEIGSSVLLAYALRLTGAAAR